MTGAHLPLFGVRVSKTDCYLARMKFVLLGTLALAACTPTGSDSVAPDAAPPMVDAAPPEPKPMFTASAYVDGDLAIDDAGIRATYTKSGTQHSSQVLVSLTEAGKTDSCTVTLTPKFVSFGSASTSSRQFKTVIIDFANSTVVDDKCHFDDAWITSQLDAQFGHYDVGFAMARFTEDQPYLDVFLDADKTFPNSTANITRAGAGTAYGMTADGAVTFTMVQPTPGTLVPALYHF